MNDKQLKGFALAAQNNEYLKSIIIKSKAFTINALIKKFVELGAVIAFNRQFDKLESPTSAQFDNSNLEYLTSNLVSSFSFTLNCLIATAKELGIKP